MKLPQTLPIIVILSFLSLNFARAQCGCYTNPNEHFPLVFFQPTTANYQWIGPGSSTTLTAKVSGTTFTVYQYRWLKDGVPLPQSIPCSSSQFTTEAYVPYTVSNAIPTSQGSYQLQICHEVDEPPVSFPPNVISQPFVVRYTTAPKIVAQSQSQEVGTSGSSSVFQLYAKAVGRSPFTYQWYKNGVTIPGASGPLASLNGFAVANLQNVIIPAGTQATYTVMFSNSDGNDTSQPIGLQVHAGVPAMPLWALIASVGFMVAIATTVFKARNPSLSE